MKNIAKILFTVLCIGIIIASLVLTSKYTWNAIELRSRTEEQTKYISRKTDLNTAILLCNAVLISITDSASKYIFMRSVKEHFLNNQQNTLMKILAFLKSSSSQIDPSNGNLSATFYDDTDGKVTPAEKLNTDTDTKEGVPGKSNKTCIAEPPREDFSKCGDNIAEKKCCEYIWAWKYKKELLERAECLAGFGIIGGSEAKQGEFPHMVAVGFRRLNITGTNYRTRYSFKCGGSLISERFVLTAGHCTNLGYSTDYELQPSVVAMGGEVLSKDMILVRIDDIIKHELYKSPKYYYDVALLKLREKIVFTNRVHPACLNTKRQPQQHTPVTVTGWGTTNSKDTTHMTDHLLVANLNIIDSEKCSKMKIFSRHFKKLLSHQFCAGALEGGVDTCQGDSGGPLQVKINTTYGNIHRVIGITSFGKECGSKLPSVYINVSKVLPWIKEKVWADYTENYIEGLGLPEVDSR